MAEAMGFFTDTTVCIGCKACEVACKEWNLVPEDGLVWTGESYDNTSTLGANSWRHVAFIEQRKEARIEPERLDAIEIAGEGASLAQSADGGLRWLMSSDVCKHCTHAACLDVCPTGALFRTEYDTVVVQQDICNGCGYCVPACPFGVLDPNVHIQEVKAFSVGVRPGRRPRGARLRELVEELRGRA